MLRVISRFQMREYACVGIEFKAKREFYTIAYKEYVNFSKCVFGASLKVMRCFRRMPSFEVIRRRLFSHARLSFMFEVFSGLARNKFYNHSLLEHMFTLCSPLTTETVFALNGIESSSMRSRNELCSRKILLISDSIVFAIWRWTLKDLLHENKSLFLFCTFYAVKRHLNNRNFSSWFPSICFSERRDERELIFRFPFRRQSHYKRFAVCYFRFWRP